MHQASRDQDWHTHAYIPCTPTAQSISPGPTLQLRDKWCGVSTGFCAKQCSLSAVCRTALWRNPSASTMKRRGEHEAERGSECPGGEPPPKGGWDGGTLLRYVQNHSGSWTFVCVVMLQSVFCKQCSTNKRVFTKEIKNDRLYLHLAN